VLYVIDVAVLAVNAGSKAMEARYETLEELGSKRFYLQYRFPPSSVGEVRTNRLPLNSSAFEF
jgi:polyribonucleotide nucleotidyltransferase